MMTKGGKEAKIMKDNARAMVKASLAADSLALGVHWIYDAKKIKSDHGVVDQLIAPGPDSYHPTKKKGDFTHYGDQTLVLLKSVANSGRFDTNDFFEQWKAFFENYNGYFDSATKTTLKNIVKKKGPFDCGSLSNDIAGAARISPLILSLYNHPDQLIEAARAQTQMTHKDTNTVDAAVFFSLLAVECLKGTPPSEAMKSLSQGRFSDSPISMWTQQGLDAADQESVPAIIRFGQSCSTLEAFSGIVQVITRYENDLSGAVIQSVMAGGDNAARAAIVAMVLAAYRGLDDKTREWAEGLNRKETISACLEKIG